MLSILPANCPGSRAFSSGLHCSGLTLMYATKQTARKTTGGRVGPYTLAGDRVEDEDEELDATGEDEEEEDEGEDADMAMDTERLQDLRQRLDIARKKIDSELDKAAARDKELVASFERRVEDLRKELEALTYARAKNRHSHSLDSAGQAIEQAIRDHGDNIVEAINDGIVREIADQGSEIMEYLNNR